MTNDRYGVGQQMRNRDMDLQSFADCETFHQIAVPDGRGSTHARGVSNIVFDTQTTAWDAAQSVLNPFRASLIQVGTTIKCRHETTVSTISQLFTPGNIVSGSYESGYRNPDVAANVIEVQFPNEETNFEVEPTEREEVAAGDPIVKSTSGIKAATHPARAATWAQFLLNIERALLRTIKFSSPLDAMVTEPGDVFAFEHDVDGDTNVVGGRVTADAAASTITLDRDLVIAGTSKISVRTTGTGQLVVQERTIDEVNGTYVAGTALDLTAAWTVGDVPTEGDVFAAGPSATYRKLYRCTKIRFDQNLKVEVQGLEYDSSVYDDDPGVVEAATDALESLHLNPSAVTNLAASPLRRIGKDGSIANITRIEWSHDRDAECDVYVRRLEGPE